VPSYVDKAVAEAGVSSATPTVTATTATIQYWNGSGYTSMAVPLGASVSIPVVDVHINTTDLLGAPIKIDLTATVSTGGTATSYLATGSCALSPCTRSEATAVANSPIVGDVWLSTHYGGQDLCDLTLHVDLGSITAKATYIPAPSAT